MGTAVALALVLALGLSVTATPVFAARGTPAKCDKTAGSKAEKVAATKAEKVKKEASAEDADREADPVKAAQRALQAQGYHIGDADGCLGPKTRTAIRSFQKAHALTVTGRLDTVTMNQLRVVEQDNQVSASPNTSREVTKPGPGASTTTPDAELGKGAAATKDVPPAPPTK